MVHIPDRVELSLPMELRQIRQKIALIQEISPDVQGIFLQALHQLDSLQKEVEEYFEKQREQRYEKETAALKAKITRTMRPLPRRRRYR